MVACENCEKSGVKTVKGLCADCGKTSSRILRQIYNRTRRGRDHLPPLLVLNGPKVRPLSECNVCGVMYKPKRYDLTTCCGVECGHVWTGFKYWAKANGGRVYVRTVRNKPEPLVFVDHPPTPKICYACGDGFYPARKLQRECSDQCKEEHKKKIKAEYRDSDGYKKWKRSAKSKRRALTRGAKVGEAIDPYDVFKRDKWTCQMCGCATPKKERGSINDNAPELDHIYPLSKGGEHSMRNLQCLCRSCNQKKSDDVIEGMGYAVQAGVGHSCNT